MIIFHKNPKLIIRSSEPSLKRGLPKGYVNAIEQRLQQEYLLGAIIQCPDIRVQGFVNDLKQDSLARKIIDRAQNDPYVSPYSAISMLVINSVRPALRGYGLAMAPTRE